jgi:putative ABC transport system substrate-binding protein
MATTQQSGSTAASAPVPDPEVPERARTRTFSSRYKLDSLSRRRFLQSTIGLGLLTGCERLTGQPPPAPRTPRIGTLWGSPELGPGGAHRDAFLEGLREHGYEEGRSILIEWRYSGVPEDELRSLAAEIVHSPVDGIVVFGGVVGMAAKDATSTIPIVFTTVGDPVGLGLVASLARPGGNVTGIASLWGPLTHKRLELLKEAAPHISRVACLYDASDPGNVATMQFTQQAAGPLGVSIEALCFQAPGELDGVFEAATRLRVDALLALQGPTLRRQMQRIVDFAARSGLPATYAWREAVDVGGLMAYGPNSAAQIRRAGYYVDRVLKGTQPADLPVEQPTQFDFVINLKTAQALGLAIPQHVLVQATDVIQ